MLSYLHGNRHDFWFHSDLIDFPLLNFLGCIDSVPFIVSLRVNPESVDFSLESLLFELVPKTRQLLRNLFREWGLSVRVDDVG